MVGNFVADQSKMVMKAPATPLEEAWTQSGASMTNLVPSARTNVSIRASTTAIKMTRGRQESAAIPKLAVQGKLVHHARLTPLQTPSVSNTGPVLETQVSVAPVRSSK